MFLVSSPQVSVVNNSHGRERNSFISWACSECQVLCQAHLVPLVHHVFLTTPCGRYDHWSHIAHEKTKAPVKLRNFPETTQLIKTAEPGFKSTYEFYAFPVLALLCTHTSVYLFIR